MQIFGVKMRAGIYSEVPQRRQLGGRPLAAVSAAAADQGSFVLSTAPPSVFDLADQLGHGAHRAVDAPAAGLEQ